jgi:hypothetical protein
MDSFLSVDAGLVLMPEAGRAAAARRAIDQQQMRQPAAAISAISLPATRNSTRRTA